jgi:hypothetical protein
MTKYFYTNGKKKYGPFSIEELNTQNISQNTLVWYYGLDDWIELKDVAELVNYLFPETTKKVSKKINDTNQDKTSSNEKIIPNKSLLLGGFLIVTGIIIIFYWGFNKFSESNKYKEIVSNSYDGGEDFDFYLDKFYRDLEAFNIFPKKPKVQIIKFSKFNQIDDATHIHGLSLGYDDDDKIEIYINEDSWKKFSKPNRYFLMYHELAHDVLNLDDLDPTEENEGRLMYPNISSYDRKNMDDFIESFKNEFENVSN